MENIQFPWIDIQLSTAYITAAIRNILNPVYLETTACLDILIREFSNGQIVAVSDGSFIPSTKGVAAVWIIESQCKSQWIMGLIHTPDPKDELNAYRSELTGLVAIMVTMKILSHCCPSPTHLIIACNGLLALKVITANRNDITANSPHADLQNIILDIWVNSST